MKKLSFLASLVLTAIFALSTLFCSAQDSIQYQLVIRNAAGQLITNKQVNMKFSLTGGGQSFYEETQKTTTDKYGNISVFIGTGAAVKGAMKDVPWSTMDISLKVESDTEGGNNFKELGTVPIAAAPYAMFAATAGSNATNGSPKDDEALFEVCDRDGQPVFAVYNSGIVVYVDESNPKAKRSGLVVTGRSSKDGESADYFAVDAEGTHIYVDDAEESSSKTPRSGLIVTGRTASKSATTDEKHISDDRTATKTDGVDMFAVSGGLTTVYVDDTDNGDKTPRSGFVVTGRTASKDDKKAIEITSAHTDIKTGTMRIGSPTDTAMQLTEKNIGIENMLINGGVRHFYDIDKTDEYNIYLSDGAEYVPGDNATTITYDYTDPSGDYNFDMYAVFHNSNAENSFCRRYNRLSSLYDSYCVPLATKESWLLFNAKKEETAIAEDAVVAVFIRYYSSYYYINVLPLRQLNDFDVSFAMTDYNQTSLINGYASEYARFNITLNSSEPYASCRIIMDGSPDPYKVKITTMNQTTEYEAGLYPSYSYQGEPAVFGEKATFEIVELPEGRVLDYWLVNGRRYTGDILKMTVSEKEIHVSAVFKDLSTVVCVDGDYEGEDSDGTEGKPFKTIDDALASIKKINDNRVDYRIDVKNTVATPIVIGNEYNGCANLIAIDFGIETDYYYSYDPEPNITQLTVSTSVPILVKGGMLIPEDNSNQTYAVKVADSKADKKARFVLENCMLGDYYGSYNMNAALVESGELVLNGTSIYNFSANKGGGAIVASGATLTLKGDAYIYGCEADEEGGGVYLNAGATLNAESCYVYGEVNSDNGAGAAVYAAGAVNFTVNNNARISGVGVTKGAYITAVGEFSDERSYYNDGTVYYYPKVTFDYIENPNDVVVVTDKDVSETQRDIIMANFGISSQYLEMLGYSRQLGLDGRPYKLSNLYTRGFFTLDFGSEPVYVDYTYYRNATNDEYLHLDFHFNNGNHEYRNYWLVDNKIYRDTIYASAIQRSPKPVQTFEKEVFSRFFSDCNWNDAWDENYVANRPGTPGKMLEITDKSMLDGCTTETVDGSTHYYITENSKPIDYLSERGGVVEGISSISVFNGNLPDFKNIIGQSIGILGKDLEMDDVTGVSWISGYTLIGYSVTQSNIDNSEPTFQQNLTGYNADSYRKYSLDETDRMFGYLHMDKAFKVTINVAACGSVTATFADGHTEEYAAGTENTLQFNYGDVITLKATHDDGCIFTGWGDGCIDDERTIMATKTNMNLNAGFSRVIYVSANVSAEDEQIGSEELPFASLTQATDLMTVDADYTVYIDGEIKGNFTIPAAAESHEKTVSIIGNNKATCILNGNNSGSTLTIGENVKVNLKNLTIKGSGRNDGDCGIKMYAENSESTTLDNVNINGNYNGIGFKHGYLYVNSGTEITNNYYGIRTYAISNYWMGDGIRVGGGQILSNTQYDVYYYAQVNMLLWQNCSLTIGGNATIGKIFIKRYGFRYNGVYYYFLNKISISSSLNNHSQTNPISVTIDNDNPIDDGGQLLSGSNLAEESKKFVIAPTEDGGPKITWRIDENGYLRKNVDYNLGHFNNAPTKTDYEYEIDDEAGMINLAKWVNEGNDFSGITIKLKNNVTLTEAFTAPIGKGKGSDGKPFAGVFDGCTHTISGLNTAQYTTTTDYPALFGNVKGIIKNLTVEGSSVCSGIVGYLYSTKAKVDSCENKVNVKTANDDYYAGGIVSFVDINAQVLNCVNSGKIEGRDITGGIAGRASSYSSIIRNSTNNGEVIGNSCVGGIVGVLSSEVWNCVNTGTVNGTNYIGGIVGMASHKSEDNLYGVMNSYNRGQVTGDNYVGGIQGAADVSTELWSTVRYCYNAGEVVANADVDVKKGGIIGVVITGGTGRLQLRNNYYYAYSGVEGVGGFTGDGETPDITNVPAAFDESESSIQNVVSKLNEIQSDYSFQSGSPFKVWVIREGGDGYPEFGE